MKLQFKTIFLSIFVGVLPVAVSASPEPLVFSHVVSPDTPKGKMATMFKTLVERTLGDKYTIVIRPNAEMMDDDDAIDAVARGKIHFAVPSVSKFQGYTDKLKIYDLPFLFPDHEAIERFQQGSAGQSLLTSMDAKGIRGIGYLYNGMKQLTANKPFHEPADLAGLSFRIMDSDVLEQQFRTIDAIPLPMAFADVYQGLATGLIQGQENTWSNIYSQKFYEHQPYIMESNHGVLDYMVITNARFWGNLSEEDLRHFEYALQMALEYGNSVSKAKAMNDRDEIRRMRDIELFKPTPSELRVWQDAMKPVWEAYEDEIGKDLIDAALAAGQTET
ncbi:TRAP transporter substrate-binding protein [Marinobacter nanhaiticus D15-8W]|uniref:TRAP transporter substrate-binding protein DctP n=1 Tax=Marinobacter nanhaiticus D15-8W TaxID=626887 RepID=N6W078_9GAMM|nr:DctP family TRAP transporter solute-binding subunit [Marinobacter nanhaiticus]ENO15935.1 TRAP transporter substrate-binding protein DctP [Marinobacter nanhaiticus D15-8W]BES73207.1 TRAP transporter substrate-binding protein [Marinobacter nanhaiticus D15-8W]